MNVEKKKNMKNNDRELDWDTFIKGLGISRVSQRVQQMKQIVYHRCRWLNKENDIGTDIYKIRMELLQLEKHRRIALNYVYELEARINKQKNQKEDENK